MTETVQQIGERALLSGLRDRLAPAEGVVIGPGDDAAALSTSSLTLVTTDALVEDVHFRLRSISAADLGRKAMAVNVSDIAAMGGRPRFATVSLCLRPDTPVDFVNGLYDGLIEGAAGFGVAIVGGNVSSIVGPLVIDVTLLGDAHPDRILRRSTGRSGDLLAVTGSLGAAAAGLLLLEAGERAIGAGIAQQSVEACLRAQWTPSPPVAFAAEAASEGLITAAIDVSDGLSSDLLTLCRESHRGATVDSSLVPVAPHTRAVASGFGIEPVLLGLHGGEDYQLLLATGPEHWNALVAMAHRLGSSLSTVGVLNDVEGVITDSRTNTALTVSAFQHFDPRRFHR